MERYFLVVVDGTGRLTFPERHCSHCLTATHGGKTIYYHPVLEAKLVTYDGLVFSLLTEFTPHLRWVQVLRIRVSFPRSKTASSRPFTARLSSRRSRLAERLKQRFPRLPLG